MQQGAPDAGAVRLNKAGESIVRTVRIAVAATAALGASFAVATTASALPASDKVDTSNKSISLPCIDNMTGAEEGTFTWTGPTAAWPPNHKDKAAAITLTDDDADESDLADDVTLAVAAGHDEQLKDAEGNLTGSEANGSGNTDTLTDATGGATSGDAGSATQGVTFRAERAGTGDGRVYTFVADGTVNGASTGVEDVPGLTLTTCEPVTFTVTVPHDLGGGNDGATKRKRSAKLRTAKLRRSR